jgi:hypothetical protein
MSQSITDYLKDTAYPRLDAVETGLLDHLSPSNMSAGGNYVLLCPQCGKREAYYYPTHSHVNCNRKNKCGASTSLWNILASSGLTPAEIVARICEKAGVPVPERTNRRAQSNSSGQEGSEAAYVPQISPGKAIFTVTQALAKKNPQMLQTLKESRGFSDEEMALMKLGVYTTPQEVLDGLLSLGITRETAIAKGYIEVDKDNPDKLLKGTSGRVVGYWPHPDKDVRIWGRLPSGSGDRYNPKYRFAPTISKEIPYLFQMRKPTILCAIEGMFDAWSLSLMGFWVACVGGDRIIDAQAAYFAGQNVTELAFITDGDTAGYDAAVATIRNCESLGIVVNIVPLGAGMDDPDALRRAGRGEEMIKMIERRMNSGEYLARLATSYASEDPPNIRGLRRISAAASQLTPVSMRKWVDYRGSLSVPVHNETTALRMLASLSEAGFDFESAAKRVMEQTGYEFTMQG